ncbi:unnamed protein product [Paramecium sonneborni]|uniref:Uncharacterized protein n=1 Tax=Paramecium sonneborni TaxID=65129 RepID=A0A8S1R8G1_9CILI|nr:unnamed protein product [Paramecium sonneborni]
MEEIKTEENFQQNPFYFIMEQLRGPGSREVDPHLKNQQIFSYIFKIKQVCLEMSKKLGKIALLVAKNIGLLKMKGLQTFLFRRNQKKQKLLNDSRKQ